MMNERLSEKFLLNQISTLRLITAPTVDEATPLETPLHPDFIEDLVVEPDTHDGEEDDEDRRTSEQTAARVTRGVKVMMS